MSRRAPPRNYDEEDDIYDIEEREHVRDPRPRRRERVVEDDIDYYRRRRSEVPVEELERLRVRERPPRDFMREGFSPQREGYPMVVRGSREEMEDISPGRNVSFEREREEAYPRPRRRRRSPEVEGEEVIVDERDRRNGRKRFSDRGFEEDDLIIRRRGRNPPYDYQSEELVIDERDTPRGKGRRSDPEVEEDDLIIRRRDRDPPRHYESEELFRDERDERKRRGRYSDRELENDLVIRGKDRGPPREYHSEEELRPRRRKPDDDREEIHFHSSTSRRRPRPRELEEEIVIFDESDHARSGGRRRRDEPDLDEDVIIRKKDPLPSRRNLRFEDDQSPPILVRDDEPEDEIRIRSRHRSGPRPAWEQVEDDDDEIIIQKANGERGRRREGSDGDDIYLRRKREISVSPDRSPSPEPIRAPPIHRDVYTHHRHIDHGFEGSPLPRAPSPRFRPSSDDFDEVDIHHRDRKGGRISEEDIVFRQRDQDVNSPPRRRPRSLDGDSESLVAERAHRHPTRNKSLRDRQKEIDLLSTRTQNRSTASKTPQDTTDEWSFVHAPPKNDPVEMTGALNVIEVEHHEGSDDAVERSGRVGPPVMDVTDRRDERWTEVTKNLVVREAIEQMGYEYEETRMFYYIFSYLKPSDIDELADLSDEIRRARRRRIHEIQRERALEPPPPAPPLERFPPRPPMLGQKRIRGREWILDARR